MNSARSIPPTNRNVSHMVIDIDSLLSVPFACTSLALAITESRFSISKGSMTDTLTKNFSPRFILGIAMKHWLPFSFSCTSALSIDASSSGTALMILPRESLISNSTSSAYREPSFSSTTSNFPMFSATERTFPTTTCKLATCELSHQPKPMPNAAIIIPPITYLLHHSRNRCGSGKGFSGRSDSLSSATITPSRSSQWPGLAGQISDTLRPKRCSAVFRSLMRNWR